MPSRRYSGQSLSEYGLAFGLVVVVAIGATIALRNQTSATLDNANQSIFGAGSNGKINNIQGLLTTANVKESPVTAATTVTNDTGLKTVNLTLRNGQQLSLENYPADLGVSVETVGTNGTTELLLANLQSIAQQLKEKGEISEAQFNQFSALSNSGHKIASIQKQVEDLAQSSANINIFTAIKPTVDNRNFTSVGDLLKEVAFYSTDAKDDTQLKSFLVSQNFDIPELSQKSDLVAGDYTRTFINNFMELQDKGALKDPAIRQVVTQLSSQILKLSDSFEGSIYKITSIGNNVPIPQQLKENMASDLSNQKSSSICETGGGKDSGIHCPDQKG